WKHGTAHQNAIENLVVIGRPGKAHDISGSEAARISAVRRNHPDRPISQKGQLGAARVYRYPAASQDKRQDAAGQGQSGAPATHRYKGARVPHSHGDHAPTTTAIEGAAVFLWVVAVPRAF